MRKLRLLFFYSSLGFARCAPLRNVLLLAAIEVKKPNKAATAEPEVLADCYSLKMKNPVNELSESEVSRVVEMAWEDRTPFEVIEATFGLSETRDDKAYAPHNEAKLVSALAEASDGSGH